METWRPIPGYEGLYEVSDHGRVRHSQTGLLRRLQANRSGYLLVRLSRDAKLRSYYVARLVVQVFLGPILDDMTVNHIDHVRTHNHVSNLEIMSRADNMRDMHTKRGLETWLRGSRHPRATMDESLVLQILAMRSQGMTTTAIALAVGKERSRIKRIVNGKSWRHVAPEIDRKTLAGKRFKLAHADIPVIRALRAAGMTYQVIADRFGVDQSMIARILKHKAYQHIP